MKPKPFLELSGISLRVNNRQAFRNTNWIFCHDQNWALIGANGSGKTLLARAIAGELPIVGGEIHYGFKTPRGCIPEDFIAMVSFEEQKALAGDSPPAARWFSTEQEASPLVGRFLSQDSVEDVNPFEVKIRPPELAVRFERLHWRITGLLEIHPLLKRPLSSLSNGEMRKILLARALLKRPRLLILDNAFEGLDSRFRIHLRDILDKLMLKKAARLILIHSRLNELPRGITHLLWIHNCRIAAQGPRRIIVRNPRIRALFQPAKKSARSRSLSVFTNCSPNRESENLVQMRNVFVRYGGRTILSGINWTIRRGESWVLVGPNGSGKSTLLSLIGGDNPQAYANSLYIFGRKRGSGESIWDLKKRIGWISPELHLHFPESQSCIQTVISGFSETIGYHRAPTPQQRRRALKVLTYLGMQKLRSSPFGSLSTGLQRMTLLARALVKAPDLLLLDEPCQGLDPSHRRMFLELIESILLQPGATIIYVTHIADEIPRGIKRMLQLQNGRIYRSLIIPRKRRIVL
ncbi:MAG: ATP-binding cassette domain-containing protein [Acidobacteria bacterium]|nr:ATP-binding cassette domain-containing protein [Acidobacteriota bacterium]